jgi:hypothetical protein
MEKAPLRFIQSSLVYGVAGGVAGVLWLPPIEMSPAGPGIHFYLLIAGWLGMLLCGIAYHAIPRFVGQPLHSRRMAVWHFYLANVGIVGVCASIAWQGSTQPKVVGVFAGLVALGLLLFAVNLWRTMSAAPE